MSDLDKIFQLKKRWDSADGDDFGKDVYSPCLKNAKFFRTQTGFFRLKVLDRWSSALISIVQKNDVKIEILSSPDLNHDVTDILSQTLTETQKVERLSNIGQNAVLAALGLNEDGIEKQKRKFRQILFTYLIAAKKIEIKLAIMNSVQISDDLFHYKRGYFIFDDDSIIAHEGSGNLTSQGLGEQGNSLNLYKSTQESDEYDLAYIRNKVDSHWKDENDRVQIIPLDEHTLNIIKESSTRNDSNLAEQLRNRIQEEDQDTEGSIETPPPEIEIPEYINYETGKWSYQGEAVNAWIENEYQGILAMATGTGKTITSMIALEHLLRDQNPLLAVVSVPSNALLQQWKNASEDFSIKPLLYEGNDRERKLKELGLLLKTERKKLGFVIMTNDILVQEQTHNILRSLDVKKLHIGDEIHGLGREQFKNNPPDFFDYHLGLSATPNRQYDEDGTEFIFNYFSGDRGNSEAKPIFEFGLDKAIEIGVLCPYDYHVHKTYLNEYEMENFTELSLKISEMYHYKDQSVESKKKYTSLTMQRRKILENAENKLTVLNKLLQQQTDEISHTLIFASAKGGFDEDYRSDEKQIKEINKMLDNLGITHHEITGEQTKNTKLKRDELQAIIRTFIDRHIKVLTSMVVLDEGVDIPPIRQAFILSSTTKEGQWVQRRGRVLRISPNTGKEKAVIHDFLVMPDIVADDINNKKILESELKRIKEFALLAENTWSDQGPYKVISEIENILNR